MLPLSKWHQIPKEHAVLLHTRRKQLVGLDFLSCPPLLPYAHFPFTLALKNHLHDPVPATAHPSTAQGVLSLPTSVGTAQQAQSWGKWEELSYTPEFALAGQPLGARIMEGVSSTYHPPELLGTFALSWVTSSMVCWVWRHSGHVLQTNFCSKHSSQLCTCRNKPQRPEFSTKHDISLFLTGKQHEACGSSLPCRRMHREAHSS